MSEIGNNYCFQHLDPSPLHRSNHSKHNDREFLVILDQRVFSISGIGFFALFGHPQTCPCCFVTPRGHLRSADWNQTPSSLPLEIPAPGRAATSVLMYLFHMTADEATRKRASFVSASKYAVPRVAIQPLNQIRNAHEEAETTMPVRSPCRFESFLLSFHFLTEPGA
jgi:hypothetical protein